MSDFSTRHAVCLPALSAKARLIHAASSGFGFDPEDLLQIGLLSIAEAKPGEDTSLSNRKAVCDMIDYARQFERSKSLRPAMASLSAPLGPDNDATGEDLLEAPTYGADQHCAASDLEGYMMALTGYLLPAKQARWLWRVVHGETMAEISRSEGCTLANVTTQLGRARLKLRRAMLDNFPRTKALTAGPAKGARKSQGVTPDMATTA